MKVILSRKGFDDSAGGHASPILPDGTLLSLPIPDDTECSPVRYSDITAPTGESYLDIIKSLSKYSASTYTDNCRAHLDPDLASSKPNNPKWLPVFGQSNAPQSHLENQGVDVGDLFLFFGWFRQAERVNGQLQFVKGAPDLHVIWGYLQIGEIIQVNGNEAKPEYQWLKYHPHMYNPSYNEKHRKKNVVYVAPECSTFNSRLSGAGTFKLNPSLVLTREGESRSLWDLPEGFAEIMSGQRQEKVIQDNPEVEAWATGIIETSLLGAPMVSV